MRRNNRIAAMLLVAVLATGLVACGPAKEPGSGASSAAAEAAVNVEELGSEPENEETSAASDEEERSQEQPVAETAPTGAAAANAAVESAATGGETPEDGDGMTAVRIEVGEQTFAARFYDNETAQTLLAMLPLAMGDLNCNEKMYYFAESLPTGDTERPGTIRTGDIMLYHSDCLVLFYETFSSSYGGYTRLGYIEDTMGLAAALGSGSVSVTFALAE